MAWIFALAVSIVRLASRAGLARAAILQLLAREGQALLFWRDA